MFNQIGFERESRSGACAQLYETFFLQLKMQILSAVLEIIRHETK